MLLVLKGRSLLLLFQREKKKEVVKREPLPEGMKYVIKTVLHYPPRFGISCNRNFVTDVEYFMGKNVLNMFKEICFGAFVDMPKSNFQGQITKCLLMIECKRDNPNEFHVYVKKTALKFSIFEFDLISGLNCTSNIEDFQYPVSGGSVLMTKYFSKAKNRISKKNLLNGIRWKILTMIRMHCE
ncbi:uncharacterized protein LOC107866048 [Capsicum annuum]|uniref:uncharacterized protein LOC107866048 n=1 Tax=Capsicum annuum TaxID=4072 RepID=UPI001FB052A9|nr:uncharacterized protein LOC107866048 [Capsicum annuum]